MITERHATLPTFTTPVVSLISSRRGHMTSPSGPRMRRAWTTDDVRYACRSNIRIAHIVARIIV